LIAFLIARHAELTGSPRAKWILDNWQTMLPKFLKIFPHEYKRVLAQAAAPANVAASVAPTFRSVPSGVPPADLKVGATSATAAAALLTREALGG
jgi:hypothetical protein